MGSVDLRMTKRGVVLFVESYDELDELFVDITGKFSQLNGFFTQGDKISVMLRDKERYSKDITEIVSFIERMGFRVGEIMVGEMPKTKDNKGKMSIKQKFNVVDEETTASQRLNPTKVIKKTVRSGQAIVHDGDVMLIGNLNSGGEIISAGNVTILGEARGVIRAGVKGDENSLIYAIVIAPELIQIANHMAHVGSPLDEAVAYVRNGKIMVERYDEAKFSSGSDRVE